ncbi:talin-1 [Ahrensia sp. R2A130]|nr:talin-1 [Ahrensia sp. R2A130]
MSVVLWLSQQAGAIEVKQTSATCLSNRFHDARTDIGPTRKLLYIQAMRVAGGTGNLSHMLAKLDK